MCSCVGSTYFFIVLVLFVTKSVAVNPCRLHLPVIGLKTSCFPILALKLPTIILSHVLEFIAISD